MGGEKGEWVTVDRSDWTKSKESTLSLGSSVGKRGEFDVYVFKENITSSFFYRKERTEYLLFLSREVVVGFQVPTTLVRRDPCPSLLHVTTSLKNLVSLWSIYDQIKNTSCTRPL